MPYGTELVEFLDTLKRECWMWGTFKDGRKCTMGAVKYVESVCDCRDGRVFAITLRGLFNDTSFSETNEWAESNCFQRAIDFLRVLHELGIDQSRDYLQKKIDEVSP